MTYEQQARALARTRKNVLRQLHFRLDKAQAGIELARARQENEIKIDASGSLFGVLSIGVSGLSLSRLLRKSRGALTVSDLSQLVHLLRLSIAEIEGLSIDSLISLAADADQPGALARQRQTAQETLNSALAKMEDAADKFDLDLPSAGGYNQANFGR
jgi:hypothetical protein